MEIQAGSIVYSIAGRDKTDLLLVVKTCGDYAYVADGNMRKIDKLKKKKFKHLQKTNNKVEINESTLTNSEVRKILANYKPIN